MHAWRWSRPPQRAETLWAPSILYFACGAECLVALGLRLRSLRPHFPLSARILDDFERNSCTTGLQTSRNRWRLPYSLSAGSAWERGRRLFRCSSCRQDEPSHWMAEYIRRRSSPERDKRLDTIWGEMDKGIRWVSHHAVRQLPSLQCMMTEERLKAIMICKFDSNGTPVMSQYGTSKFLKIAVLSCLT